MRVQSPGFLALTGTLTVSGQNIQRNLALQVGTLSEYVAVKGGVPIRRLLDRWIVRLWRSEG